MQIHMQIGLKIHMQPHWQMQIQDVINLACAEWTTVFKIFCWYCCCVNVDIDLDVNVNDDVDIDVDAEVWSWFSKVWPRFWSSSLVKIVGSPFWSTSAIPSPTSLYLQKSYAPRLSHWKFSFNQNLSFLNRTPFGQGNSSWIDQVINKLSAFQRRSTMWLVEPVRPSRGLSIQRNGTKN